MQANSPIAFKTFLVERRPAHKDPDGSDFEEHCIQPVWRCLEHLVKLLIRTVEMNTSAMRNTKNVDGIVQADEAANFLRKRTSGINLELVSGSLGGTDFLSALDSAKVKMITTVNRLRPNPTESR